MDIENLLPLTPAVFYTLPALAEGDRHGYAIMQQARVLSLGRFRMGPGTLYSTIQRLLELGLIEEVSEPEGVEDSDSRRRYYRISTEGKALLQMNLDVMRSAVRAARGLKLAPEN